MMVSVVFTKSKTNKIKNFTKMPFREACQVTDHLEKEFQEQRGTADVDFYRNKAKSPWFQSWDESPLLWVANVALK